MDAGTSRSPDEHKPPFAYRTGLGLVVLGMVLLPVLYGALTALAGWWGWFFATHYFVEIWEWELGHSRYSLLLKALCSVTPLLAGGAIVVAMVKPLFARRARHMQPAPLPMPMMKYDPSAFLKKK